MNKSDPLITIIWWWVSAKVHDSIRLEMHLFMMTSSNFLRYWPFARGMHRLPVNSPHKGQWRGALMLSFIYAWINSWVNNREADDFRRHRAHYDVSVMFVQIQTTQLYIFQVMISVFFIRLILQRHNCGLDVQDTKITKQNMNLLESPTFL